MITTLNVNQIVAILAAIIYAGADDNQSSSGYSPANAVKIARIILRESEAQPPNPIVDGYLNAPPMTDAEDEADADARNNVDLPHEGER